MRYFVLKTPIDKTHIYEVSIDKYGKICKCNNIPICGDTDAKTVIYENDQYYSSDVIIDYIYHIMIGKKKGNLCSHCVGSFFEDIQRGER